MSDQRVQEIVERLATSRAGLASDSLNVWHEDVRYLLAILAAAATQRAALETLVKEWREQDTWELPVYGTCADELSKILDAERPA